MTLHTLLSSQRLLGDRYRIERHLGSGGMAEVYVAQDLRHNRDVAVKVLKPELASALATERFLREVEIAAHLSHPHILPVYDSGEIDGLPYYVMPLVRGENLKQRLARERQLSLEDGLRIATEVAEALAQAHAQGVVHRDIKPENILLEHGHVRVADFGVAYAVSAAGGERLTDSGIAVGTPVYMSPEQAAGERQVDARSDVYSLGCVLYEMLGGEPPFLGASAQAILARKATQDAPSLRAIRGTVTPAMERLVRKAMARSRADRFNTGEEFAHALRRYATTTDEERSAAGPTTGMRRRALTLGALVTLAIGVTVATVRRNVNTPGRTIRALAVMPISGDSDGTTLAGDIHTRLIDELAHVQALRVTGAVSSLRYGRSTKHVPEIAKELNVQALVQSSTRSIGDTVHVHVRLIHGATGEQLWAREFVAQARHLERLQKEVTREIATYLQVPLTPEDLQRLARYRVIDARANEAYQRGMRLSSSFDPGRFPKSIAAFEEAIRLDPEDPAPHVALALTYTMMGAGHDTIPADVAFGRAKQSAERALQLDPRRSEAHTALAVILHFWDWDWVAAKRELESAIELNPGSVEGHFRYGVFLRSMAPADSAVAELQRARRIDPLSTIVLSDLSAAYVWAGKPDSAVKWARESLDLDPTFAPARWALGEAFMEMGQHDSSIAEHERAVELNPQFRGHLAQAYAAAGRLADFDRVIAGLTERDKRRLSLILSKAYGLRGDREAMYHWIDVAIDEHSPWIDQIRDPYYRRFSSEPRFQAELRKLALPPI